MCHGRAALREGGRIQDDEVERTSLFLETGLALHKLRQVFHDIGAREVHPVVQVVEPCILLGKRDGGIGDIDAADELGPSCGSIEAERPYMAEAVKDTASLCKLSNRSSVVLLVEEEAGLLAVLYVQIEEKAVFLCHDTGVVRCGDAWLFPPALVKIESLEPSRGRVCPLIDATDLLAIGTQDIEDQREEHLFPQLHAIRPDLRHKHILVAVDNEAGHAIRFAEEDAAAVRIRLGSGHGARAHDSLPVLPGPEDAAPPEAFVEAVVRIVGEHAHTNLGLHRKKASSLPGAVLLEEVDDSAILGGTSVLVRLQALNLSLEDPEISLGEHACSLLRDVCLRIRTCLFHGSGDSF